MCQTAIASSRSALRMTSSISSAGEQALGGNQCNGSLCRGRNSASTFWVVNSLPSHTPIIDFASNIPNSVLIMTRNSRYRRKLPKLKQSAFQEVRNLTRTLHLSIRTEEACLVTLVVLTKWCRSATVSDEHLLSIPTTTVRQIAWC